MCLQPWLLFDQIYNAFLSVLLNYREDAFCSSTLFDPYFNVLLVSVSHFLTKSHQFSSFYIMKILLCKDWKKNKKYFSLTKKVVRKL